MKTVLLFTDGACSGNPGPGGWGAILICGEHKKEPFLLILAHEGIHVLRMAHELIP